MRRALRIVAGGATAAALCAAASAACAQVDLISPETWHGLVDVRAVAVNGEPGFGDHGFGKLRYGGQNGGYETSLRLAEAAVEWRPRLTWDITGVVDVVAQPDQDERPIDVSQAYLTWRPTPTSATRFSGRVGMYYPAISLEHDAPVWGLTNTITPSAINSWVGEEVRVIGAEAGVAHEFEGGQRLALTAGVFGGGDTAGTLLTYRGWALHDLKATALGAFNLPPLGPFSQFVQPDETYSTREIDKRLGFYARLEWRLAPPLELEAFYYDNRGDEVGVTLGRQWAWYTQFANLGARWTIDERTRLLGQAMSGRTRDGFPTPQGLFGDVSFRSAYAELQRDIGRSTATGRLDWFETRDHTTQDIFREDEDGWAITGAWRYPITRQLDFRAEALHVRSNRPSRGNAGLPAVQSQTQLQSSLRYTF